jgi:hypothetical protein
VSSSAEAGWVEIAASSEKSLTLYSDPATIRKNGNIVKMWDLTDFKTAQEEPNYGRYLSSKVHGEYDCKKERWRILYFSLHSGNMGGGAVIRSDSKPDIWSPVAPASSISTSLWKIACRKR